MQKASAVVNYQPRQMLFSIKKFEKLMRSC